MIDSLQAVEFFVWKALFMVHHMVYVTTLKEMISIRFNISLISQMFICFFLKYTYAIFILKILIRRERYQVLVKYKENRKEYRQCSGLSSQLNNIVLNCAKCAMEQLSPAVLLLCFVFPESPCSNNEKVPRAAQCVIHSCTVLQSYSIEQCVTQRLIQYVRS